MTTKLRATLADLLVISQDGVRAAARALDLLNEIQVADSLMDSDSDEVVDVLPKEDSSSSDAPAPVPVAVPKTCPVCDQRYVPSPSHRGAKCAACRKARTRENKLKRDAAAAATLPDAELATCRTCLKGYAPPAGHLGRKCPECREQKRRRVAKEERRRRQSEKDILMNQKERKARDSDDESEDPELKTCAACHKPYVPLPSHRGVECAPCQYQLRVDFERRVGAAAQKRKTPPDDDDDENQDKPRVKRARLTKECSGCGGVFPCVPNAQGKFVCRKCE